MKHNNHDYVDLGLPSGTLWATCNVGASRPEEYGDYFAWGETAPKDNYNLNTYKLATAAYEAWDFETLTKYNTDSNYCKTTLDPEDDAAAANWGGKWRMPTDDEWTELRENCTWICVQYKNGYEVKSKTNGNSIFLPAAGYRDNDILFNAGNYGYYWSSSLRTGSPDYVWYMYFNSCNMHRDGSRRYYGQTVRPVCVND